LVLGGPWVVGAGHHSRWAAARLWDGLG
jgi:hypothetical protein